eukprot:1338707-Rhodomonas_salina.3
MELDSQCAPALRLRYPGYRPPQAESVRVRVTLAAAPGTVTVPSPTTRLLVGFKLRLAERAGLRPSATLSRRLAGLRLRLRASESRRRAGLRPGLGTVELERAGLRLAGLRLTRTHDSESGSEFSCAAPSHCQALLGPVTRAGP